MYYVGIDVAKDFHVVTVIDQNEVKVFKKAFRVNNHIQGFNDFISKLESISYNLNFRT
ncbi:MAG: IS110 family transposase [Arcobacter sp.]|nr:IS110 family transposase [Arcobacter sp.]